MAVPDVHPIEALRLINESGAILLDVREDDEWTAGHAPGAVHVRLGVLDAHTYDTAGPVVAVCRSGQRSLFAAGQLAAVGVTAYNLVGGMKAWWETGQPVVHDDATVGTVI